MKIRCITLFDITKTNVSQRRRDLELNLFNDHKKARNQQSNFETILQIISLRSQPEDITEPVKQKITPNLWGKNYNFKKTSHNEWTFTFTINHSSVFKDLNDDLGKLKKDCDGVPMILELEEYPHVFKSLNISDNYKNIHFELEND